MKENKKREVSDEEQKEIETNHIVNACRMGDLGYIKRYGNDSLEEIIMNWRSNLGGVTLLMESAWYGRKRIVEYLVSQGADVNIEDEYDNTALIACCSKNWNHSTDIASFLINHGADVNQKCKADVGSSSLTLATLLNNKIMVKLLLKKGANPNHLDEYGENPYCYAIYNEDYYHTRNESLEDNKEIIKILSKETDLSIKPKLSLDSKKATEDPYKYFKEMRTDEYLRKRFTLI